jgi:thermitase
MSISPRKPKNAVMPMRIALLTCLLVLACAGSAQASDVIVQYAPGTDSSDRARVADLADPGVKVKDTPYQAYDASSSEVKDLRADPSVASVEPDVTYQVLDEADCSSYPACDKPNDPFFHYQWSLNNDSSSTDTGGLNPWPANERADILAPEGWGLRSATPPRIAVADTGIAPSHPDLDSSVIVYKKDEVPGDASTDDHFGHGTEVSGVIGAKRDNGIGIAGVAPDAQISMFKVSDTGSIPCSNVAAAVTDAIGHADVINLSLGSTSPCTAMRSAIDAANAADVTVVASAGNAGTSTKNYPAAWPEVVSVASTDESDQLSSFSSYGASWVDLAAPGQDIASTTMDNDYAFVDGTSFSAPEVSAVVGMLYPLVTDTNGNGKRDEVLDRLLSSTDAIPASGSGVATGRLDLCRALGGDTSRCGPPVSPSVTSTHSAPSPVPTTPTPLPTVTNPGTAAKQPTTTVRKRRALATVLRAHFGKKVRKLRINGSRVSFVRGTRTYRGSFRKVSDARWKLSLAERRKGARSSAEFHLLLR